MTMAPFEALTPQKIMVRNTFIDWPCEEAKTTEGVFSTWPISKAPTQAQEGLEEGECEEGECSSEDEPLMPLSPVLSTASAQRTPEPTPGSSRTVSKDQALEEGEISDDEEDDGYSPPLAVGQLLSGYARGGGRAMRSDVPFHLDQPRLGGLPVRSDGLFPHDPARPAGLPARSNAPTPADRPLAGFAARNDRNYAGLAVRSDVPFPTDKPRAAGLTGRTDSDFAGLAVGSHSPFPTDKARSGLAARSDGPASDSPVRVEGLSVLGDEPFLTQNSLEGFALHPDVLPPADKVRNGAGGFAIPTEEPPPAETPRTGGNSRGSATHGTGKCKPCAWMHKGTGGCRNGDDCEYCHLCPAGELRRRKREKIQRRMDEVRKAEQIALAAKAAAEQAKPTPAVSSSAPPLPSGAPPGLGDDNLGSETGRPGPIKSILELEPCYVEVSGLSSSATSSFVNILSEPAAVPPAPPRVSSKQKNKDRPPGYSVGSTGHDAGVCRPCAWVHKLPGGKGCKNGASCKYCHLCPPGELKRRKREKWEKLALKTDTDETKEPSETESVSSDVVATSAIEGQVGVDLAASSALPR